MNDKMWDTVNGPSFTGNYTDKPFYSVYSTVGDFTPFYIAIAIGSVILGSILILNIICCCSRYSDYWLDRHTGNRWIVSIWSTTPHKQPPLDFTELESQYQTVKFEHPYYPDQYQEVQKRESIYHSTISQQPFVSSQDYLELHKRESDL